MFIKLPCNIAICGNTMCGKSFLLSKLIQHQFLPQLDYLIFFSPTIAISNDYNEFESNDNIKQGKVIMKFNEPQEFKNILEEIVESQHSLLVNHKKKEVPMVMVVFDDCVSHSILTFKGFLDKLSTKSRHYNISIVVLAQRITAIPRTYRLNTKYFILFNSSNYTEMARFIEEYVPKKYSKSLQNHLEDIFNQDYNFILCHNFATKIKDRLYLNGEENIVDKFLE